jgi:hypothetical protein
MSRGSEEKLEREARALYGPGVGSDYPWAYGLQLVMEEEELKT